MKYKTNVSNKFTLGTIGGMGPLASSMFVNSLYKYQSNIVKEEQDYLRIISFSDPTVPDRTKCLLNGQETVLIDYLMQHINYLLEMGCDEIVILCITLHALLDKLPHHYQNKLRNLVTTALTKLIDLQQPILLLATSATYQFSIFEKNDLWQKSVNLLIKPTAKDQAQIHEMVYQLKFLRNIDQICEQIYQLVCKYNAAGWMAGCTEFSLLGEQFNKKYTNNIEIVDPLSLVIQHYANKYNS